MYRWLKINSEGHELGETAYTLSTKHGDYLIDLFCRESYCYNKFSDQFEIIDTKPEHQLLIDLYV